MSKEVMRPETAKKALACLIRNELAVRNCSFTDFDYDWIEIKPSIDGRLDTIVHFPVSQSLVVPILSAVHENGDWFDHAELYARDLVRALPNLRKAAPMLRRYAADVRRAADAAISTAQRRGAEITLKAVCFSHTPASHLILGDWHDAADHVLAELRIGGLDAGLQPDTLRLIVEEADDAAGEIESIVDEQIVYQRGLKRIRDAGAHIAIDEMTLRFMAKYGIDPVQALRRVAAIGHLNQTVQASGSPKTNLYLVNSSGIVRSAVNVRDDDQWSFEALDLGEPTEAVDAIDMIGRYATDLCDDDVFAGITIAAIRTHGGRTIVDLSQPEHYFNADTGEIWPAEKAA